MAKRDEEEFAYISRAPKPRQEQPQENYSYLKTPIFVDSFEERETLSDKLKRRAKHNPFVLGGIGVTCFALFYGIYQLKTGNDWLGFRMQQLRISAQAFTILAIVAGEFHWNYLKKKKKEEQLLRQQQKK